MKKKTVILLGAAAAVILAAVVICVSVFCGKSAKFVDMTASEEAKKLYSALFAGDDAEIVSEGTFDYVVPILYFRGEQTFPEVATENPLGCFEQGDVQVYTLGGETYDNIILYIHGGAWAFGINEDHVTFCDRLANSMHAKIYIPLYPLAPQYNSDETYEAVYALYSDLAAQGKPLYVMGDSAGANIALGLTHLIKEKGDRMPGAIVLLSPCADMSFSNPEMTEIEKSDPSLRLYGCRECAEMWADGKSLDDPLLSALYADVSGYPKTMIFFGTNDILYPDGLKLYDKLKKANVEVTFVRAEGLFHVFPIYSIPERDTSVRMITDFCK